MRLPGARIGPPWAALVVAACTFVLPGPGRALHALQSGPLSTERLRPAEIARLALPTVVQIVTYADGRKRGGGSGFVVAPEGLVATSHHVLEGADRVEVVLQSGDSFEVLHATAADDLRDLVLLRIDTFELPAATLGHSGEVAVGEPVVAIGSPLGLAGTVSDGLVSAKREMGGRSVLQISAPISKGSSGGPVFDARGRIVGVLAGYMRRGQNVNFAVPVEGVRALLEVTPRAIPIAVLARKRVSLLAGGGEEEPRLSLHAVLTGEPIPGEQDTPWALEPRRVRADEVAADPAEVPDQLAGLWEIRELTRVPGVRSGVYRGVLAADGRRLRGSFFGSLVSDFASLVSDPAPGTGFDPDRVRDFEGRLSRIGHLVLEGEHGCTYFLRASPRGMTGIYECVREGTTYDLGAVEARRIRAEGFSGRYRVTERIELGGSRSERSGEAFLYALPDGRWIGEIALEGTGGRGSVPLRAGRWTRSGHLTARLRHRFGPEVSGALRGDSLRLGYRPGDEDDNASRATLSGVRTEISERFEAVPARR